MQRLQINSNRISPIVAARQLQAIKGRCVALRNEIPMLKALSRVCLQPHAFQKCSEDYGKRRWQKQNPHAHVLSLLISSL
jgi:hypothetical protein